MLIQKCFKFFYGGTRLKVSLITSIAPWLNYIAEVGNTIHIWVRWPASVYANVVDRFDAPMYAIHWIISYATCIRIYTLDYLFAFNVANNKNIAYKHCIWFFDAFTRNETHTLTKKNHIISPHATVIFLLRILNFRTPGVILCTNNFNRNIS